MSPKVRMEASPAKRCVSSSAKSIKRTHPSLPIRMCSSRPGRKWPSWPGTYSYYIVSQRRLALSFASDVRKVGGWVKDRQWEEEAAEVKKMIEAKGIKVEENGYYKNGYDAPMKFINRRNEVWWVKKEDWARIWFSFHHVLYIWHNLSTHTYTIIWSQFWRLDNASGYFPQRQLQASSKLFQRSLWTRSVVGGPEPDSIKSTKSDWAEICEIEFSSQTSPQLAVKVVEASVTILAHGSSASREAGVSGCGCGQDEIAIASALDKGWIFEQGRGLPRRLTIHGSETIRSISTNLKAVLGCHQI